MKKLVVCALCAAMVIPAMSVSVSADSKELVLYTWENIYGNRCQRQCKG